jgi:hypothetical protein
MAKRVKRKKAKTKSEWLATITERVESVSSVDFTSEHEISDDVPIKSKESATVLTMEEDLALVADLKTASPMTKGKGKAKKNFSSTYLHRISEKLEGISSDSSSEEDTTPVKPRNKPGINWTKNSIIQLRPETATADGES